MKTDWLNDFLAWVPLLVILLMAAGLWLFARWRVRRLDLSFEHLRLAVIRQAEAGDPFAQFQAGRMYREGSGVSRDPGQADEWFDKAFSGLKKEADDGDRDAASLVYECFHEGLGVEKDAAKALFWLQRAAQEGMPEAMFTLALEYRNGGLVEKNESLFMYWLRKAAEEGDDGDAQYLLGACYEHGNGVPQDLEFARKWYDRAADHLMESADDALARLRKK